MIYGNTQLIVPAQQLLYHRRFSPLATLPFAASPLTVLTSLIILPTILLHGTGRLPAHFQILPLNKTQPTFAILIPARFLSLSLSPIQVERILLQFLP